ncbi:hypothetical protein [Helicobacter sp. MIT 05-5294]|uniref:hypothetical protein n=1 Tax=Helicobacter sp. MIT 05-5294 TaxID=1548150 RepID=UPI0010FEF11A|nr:hypothetical protein [Helicobacter sp. MIT 05-5294]TLD83761.1 hypothetical protein LS69_010030 [Helicobacter sp. MIT 05-5294]
MTTIIQSSIIATKMNFADIILAPFRAKILPQGANLWQHPATLYFKTLKIPSFIYRIVIAKQRQT